MLGINLPDEKRIDYALTLLYGIGWSTSGKIIDKVGVPRGKKVKELNEVELNKIIAVIEKDYLVEGDLREEVTENIQRLKEIGSYKGHRHTKGLPVSGQRTRSNARTKRGKRKTVGALKKEVWSKMEQQKPPPGSIVEVKKTEEVKK